MRVRKSLFPVLITRQLISFALIYNVSRIIEKFYNFIAIITTAQPEFKDFTAIGFLLFMTKNKVI